MFQSHVADTLLPLALRVQETMEKPIAMATVNGQKPMESAD